EATFADKRSGSATSPALKFIKPPVGELTANEARRSIAASGPAGRPRFDSFSGWIRERAARLSSRFEHHRVDLVGVVVARELFEVDRDEEPTRVVRRQRWVEDLRRAREGPPRHHKLESQDLGSGRSPKDHARLDVASHVARGALVVVHDERIVAARAV